MIKSSLQLYLNDVKNLTLRYLCFLKKAIKTVFMLCFNQFLLPISNWALCAFYTSLLILMFLITFKLEAINPRNIWACLDSLNVNMELFPRGLAPVTQVPRLPASFRFLLREKRYVQTKPWIYHWKGTSF